MQFFIIIFVAKIKFSYQSKITAYFNIIVYWKILDYILENIELSMRDKIKRASEKKYKKVFGCFIFLVTRPNIVLQAPLL